MRKNRKIKKKNSKLNKIFLIISSILLLVLLIMVTVLNVVPFKYLIILYTIALLFGALIAFLLLKKNSKIGYGMSLIFIVISIILIYFFNTTYNFLSYFNKDNYKTENFLVIVLEDSYYQKLEDLSDKDIGYVKNNITSIDKALDKINKKINIKNLEYDNYNLVFDDMLAKKLSSSLIEESNYNVLLEENPNYGDKFRIIDTIKIITKIDNKNTSVNVTKNTFNILISGIDTDGEISSVGRSDVNMILTVNPSTKQVLMTSIPRDYYVRLHGTSGYKDKLTHAGIYGIDMSISTIEDLLDVDINYYFRVNFTTLEKVIDALGGVDVYSKYSFVSYIGNYKFYEGYNHMNGNEALGFARERKTLPNGDINRAENQQAVIDGIIRKLTDVSVITKYSSILNSLENTFQTNMTNKDITSLIKMQLNDNASWNITSNVLTGTGSSDYTYSYKGQKLYVMIPDDDSVNSTKNLIDKVKNGTLLESSYDKNASNIKNPNKVYSDNSNSNSNTTDDDKKENNSTTNNVEEKDKNDNQNTTDDNVTDENNTNSDENNDNENKDKDKDKDKDNSNINDNNTNNNDNGNNNDVTIDDSNDNETSNNIDDNKITE